jgi:hypothetical protein
MKLIYYLGLIYLGFCILLAFQSPLEAPVDPSRVQNQTNLTTTNAERWFQTVRPYCNSVEVGIQHKYHAPFPSHGGAGYSAACFALAGEMDRARETILRLNPEDRWRAAGVVFGVAHPIADAGDDVAAGPMMELVVEFWPNHYMALYHAGMSRYTLGNHRVAREYLRQFLENYAVNDGWTRNATRILESLKKDATSAI